MSIQKLASHYILPSFFSLCLDLRHRGRYLDLDLVFTSVLKEKIKYLLTRNKVPWTFVTKVFYFYKRIMFVESGYKMWRLLDDIAFSTARKRLQKQSTYIDFFSDAPWSTSSNELFTIPWWLTPPPTATAATPSAPWPLGAPWASWPSRYARPWSRSRPSTSGQQEET